MISKFAAANRRLAVALLAASTALASPIQAQAQAAHQPASPAVPIEASQAIDSAEPVIAIPVPLPLPGQLKQFPQRTPPYAAGRSRPSLPRDRVGAAMEAARVQPERTGFINAIQVFPYTEGALYQVYAKPWTCNGFAPVA
jgi:type IV secretion system protein TrbG